MSIGLKLLTQIDVFMPHSMRSSSRLPWSYRVKAWSMVMVLALSILAPLCGLLVFAGLSLFTGMDFSQACYILLVIVCVNFFQHLYFQSYGNLVITASAYTVQAFASYVAAVYFTGGWHSPAMPIMICAPLIAFMTGGYRSCSLAIISVFLAISCFFSQRYNPHITSVIPPETNEMIGLVMWMMLLGVMAFFFMVTNTLLRRDDIRSHFDRS